MAIKSKLKNLPAMYILSKISNHGTDGHKLSPAWGFNFPCNDFNCFEKLLAHWRLQL